MNKSDRTKIMKAKLKYSEVYYWCRNGSQYGIPSKCDILRGYKCGWHQGNELTCSSLQITSPQDWGIADHICGVEYSGRKMGPFKYNKG